MDATTKASILHDIVRKMGAGGAEITTKAWLDFVEAQNDGYQTGPAIGEKVPNFTLTDQHGQPRTLNELMGPNGLLLTFSRSADW
jgi:cytochrome oxidase Cu insertion factor (SCO1/SenC/PrrC family)